MNSDGNGRIKLSAWNWLGLLGFTVMSVATVVASHFRLANAVQLEVATISGVV